MIHESEFFKAYCTGLSMPILGVLLIIGLYNLFRCYQIIYNKKLVLKVKYLTTNSRGPIKGTPYSAGYDLSSAYDYVIPAHGKELVKTDIAIVLPEGCYGRIAPRSSLAWKNHIDAGAGVIDQDYRGNVGVVLFNHSDNEFVIKKYDRVAQLILERYESPIVEECDGDLPEPGCQHDGFGSTGRR